MIPLPSDAARAAAAARQLELTKPPGALGRLEDLSLTLAAIQDRALPRCERALVLVAAADHGVCAQGVSAFPSAVTAQMCVNFCAGGAAINVLARHAQAKVEVLDVGVAGDLPALPGLIAAKVARGTADFTTAPAMTLAQVRAAMAAGAARATVHAATCDALVLGEMGIGNTTSAAALTAAFTGQAASAICGRGTGIDDAGLARKIAAVSAGLARHRNCLGDPLMTLAALGGLEIAALAGAALRAAELRLAIVVDGYISTAAVLAAAAIDPRLRPYLIFAHRGAEPGHQLALAHLQAQPLLDLELRLGEGSGGVLALHLLRAACQTLAEMATFSEAAVSGKLLAEAAHGSACVA
jgi:nicotinate-nucleotide--dimethylbenzimidazole phosphoribosyltransferase